MKLQPLHQCQRCHTPYDWRRSTSSSLKMTYCSALCEKGALGFTIESLLGPTVHAPPAHAHRDPALPALAGRDLLAA